MDRRIAVDGGWIEAVAGRATVVKSRVSVNTDCEMAESMPPLA